MRLLNIGHFTLGPNEDLNTKINEIKTRAEDDNKHLEIVFEIIDETTENCAPGCKTYQYKLSGIDKP